jgi:hypothetical protein
VGNVPVYSGVPYSASGSALMSETGNRETRNSRIARERPARDSPLLSALVAGAGQRRRDAAHQPGLEL